MVGLDQYGAEPFEQRQFGTAGVEGVKKLYSTYYLNLLYRTDKKPEQFLVLISWNHDYSLFGSQWRR